MARRTLRFALCGAGSQNDAILAVLNNMHSPDLANGVPAASIEVAEVAKNPTRDIAAACHLVISVDGEPSDWSDVSISTVQSAEDLAEARIGPWASKWQEGRRAPRAQTAVLADPDPNWAATAARLISRIETHTSGVPVQRIDHIGSTSLPGLAAKNLIDIQITIPPGADTVEVAQAATNAGFVHVQGEWSGKDRNGNLHPEEVCVDSDPGRPVNVNIRAADNPVARDALLFRDWLRANSDARDRYLQLKSELAGRQIDEYGDNKEPFISAALHDAESWAATTGWKFDSGSGG